MKLKIRAAVIALATILSPAIQAAVLVVGTGGGNDGLQAYSTGITNLVVGSKTYNVTFLAENQSFNNAFGLEPSPGPQTFDYVPGSGTRWPVEAEPLFSAILTELEGAGVNWVGPTGKENEFWFPYLAGDPTIGDVRAARGNNYIPGLSSPGCGTDIAWHLCAGTAADSNWEFPRNDVSAIPWAQVTVVPVPAAVWLFGSGLLCLVGITRRKAHV